MLSEKNIKLTMSPTKKTLGPPTLCLNIRDPIATWTWFLKNNGILLRTVQVHKHTKIIMSIQKSKKDGSSKAISIVNNDYQLVISYQN
jgi:hypothetical protein